MRKIGLLIALLCSCSLGAQEVRSSALEQVRTIDDIVASIYEIISGEKGEERDWDLMHTVFHPDARLMYGNEKEMNFLTVNEYISRFRESLKQNKFYEKPVNNEIDVYGNMAHVWSTYQRFSKENGGKELSSGLASIQLFHDGDRWWVLGVYWKNEMPHDPIPEAYLPE